MINIDKYSFVGNGHHREVYRHPENQNLCIKIIVDGNFNSRQVRREKAYYRYLEDRGISWDMIPKYYGDIQTNLGIGSVFDLILDQDGSVSKTLENYITSNEVTEAHYHGLSKSLHSLKDYLLKQRIITMTPAPKNIVCQKDKSGISRLYVVDNISNSDLIPICNYINRLAEKKIYRRWKRFEDKLLDRHSYNQALHRMLTTSHVHG